MTYDAATGISRNLIATSQERIPKLWFGIYETYTTFIDPTVLGEIEQIAWSSDTTLPDYERQVEVVRSHIAAGDVYQCNYTIGLNGRINSSPYNFYRTLRQRNRRSGYCAYVRLPNQHIISISPELFVQIDGNRVKVKPMKGTIGRLPTHDDDCANARLLHNSVKDRAEHVMIVDLMRNDLGKLAVTGTVEVKDLFTVETYDTVHQMVSTIEADLPRGTGIDSVFGALFPSGSITGAPKIASMKIVSDIETRSRGVYCGTIGYIEPSGNSVFNVAIRTIGIDSNGDASCGVGGAIVWDSQARLEWKEALLKSEFVTRCQPAFSLFESILLEDGRYYLLDRHLRRLSMSGNYFAFHIDADGAMNRLEKQINEFPVGRWKVRISVSPSGEIGVITAPAAPSTDTALNVSISALKVSSTDIFLYHKTTHRSVYIEQLACYPGVDDVIMVNERGEITEFTIGNIVAEIDGVLWTPPIKSGLLAGTLRDELLDSGEIRERVILAAELKEAAKLWRINSVRGWNSISLKNLLISSS